MNPSPIKHPNLESSKKIFQMTLVKSCSLHSKHHGFLATLNKSPSRGWHGRKRQIRRCQLSIVHAGPLAERQNGQRQQQRQDHGTKRNVTRKGAVNTKLTPAKDLCLSFGFGKRRQKFEKSETFLQPENPAPLQHVATVGYLVVTFVPL